MYVRRDRKREGDRRGTDNSWWGKSCPVMVSYINSHLLWASVSSLCISVLLVYSSSHPPARFLHTAAHTHSYIYALYVLQRQSYCTAWLHLRYVCVSNDQKVLILICFWITWTCPFIHFMFFFLLLSHILFLIQYKVNTSRWNLYNFLFVYFSCSSCCCVLTVTYGTPISSHHPHI